MIPIDVPRRFIPRLPPTEFDFEWEYRNERHRYTATLRLTIDTEWLISNWEVIGVSVLENRFPGGVALSPDDGRLWEKAADWAWEDFSDDDDAQRRAVEDYRRP